MGHMANEAHDHNFLNTAWILTKFLLDIDIDVFYLDMQENLPGWPHLSTKIIRFQVAHVLIGSKTWNKTCAQLVFSQLLSDYSIKSLDIFNSN